MHYLEKIAVSNDGVQIQMRFKLLLPAWVLTGLFAEEKFPVRFTLSYVARNDRGDVRRLNTIADCDLTSFLRLCGDIYAENRPKSANSLKKFLLLNYTGFGNTLAYLECRTQKPYENANKNRIPRRIARENVSEDLNLYR